MKNVTVLSLTLAAFAGLSAYAAPLAVPRGPNVPEEPMIRNGFRMSAIEYWGNGGYDSGRGVSFGYLSNAKDWNRKCALLAYAELKKTLEGNSPELKAMADAGGPKTIYLIVSDNSAVPQPLEAGVVWHYNANEVTNQGGLMKFHAFAHKGENGAYQCNFPKEADVVRFAVETRQKIEAARRSAENPRASDRNPSPAGQGEAEPNATSSDPGVVESN